MAEKSVVVGLSGGVDSAVAAYLLKKEGYRVVGVTMRQFEGEDFSTDAANVAKCLGIEHRVLDMTSTFKAEVIDYFINAYKNGETPNPCVRCNPFVKFRSLIMVADELGIENIATGHYAKTENVDGRMTLHNSSTAKKDQTYCLCYLTDEELRRVLFPLGDYTKEEVRKVAKEAGIPVADKGDSQDICFIPDGDYAAFIERYSGWKPMPGNFVDKDGKVLGRHEGISHYTIGQRKGLNLAMGHPVFVTKIIPGSNEVVIGESEDLFSDTCFCTDMEYMCGADSQLPKRLVCKVRYAHKGTACTLYKDKDRYKIVFDEPVRAATPGQTAVFYDGENVYSGAKIV